MAADAVTKAQWKKDRVHDGITLPSGAIVSIRIPNLPLMVKTGQLPNPLVEVATTAAATGQVPPDLLERLEEYNRFLVAHTVVEPKITEEDVDDLPYEDIELLVQLATRSTDMDAVGHHIAGLERVESFRQFRGLDSSFSGLLGS